MDTIENRNNIYKISIDMENLAYKISHLEDEMAKLYASVEELKGREDDVRRLVT